MIRKTAITGLMIVLSGCSNYATRSIAQDKDRFIPSVFPAEFGYGNAEHIGKVFVYNYASEPSPGLYVRGPEFTLPREAYQIFREGDRLILNLSLTSGNNDKDGSGAGALCNGEENKGQEKYSEKVVSAIAQKRVQKGCDQIGGKLLTETLSVSTSTAARVRSLAGGLAIIVPARRKCYEAKIQVKCDVSMKLENAKEVAGEFESKYPDTALSAGFKKITGE